MNNLLKKDFSQVKSGINIPRAKFGRPSQLKTSFNVGELVPIYLDEVLPGDTWQMYTAFVARMSTPIKPTMDNLYLDIAYFFVPNRLVWDHWEEFQGANENGYWEQSVEYNEIFGYQEAWADYRSKPSIVTGEMRSSYPLSLDVWHYADDYSELPTLSNTWIQEPTTNIDRTLSVTSENSNQFIADFYFDGYVTRPIPVFSVPGLNRL